MSSYLFVTVLGCGPLRVVETTEDGVLAKALLDFQLHLLHAALLVHTGLLLLLQLLQSLVVRKQVQLLGVLMLRDNS